MVPVVSLTAVFWMSSNAPPRNGCEGVYATGKPWQHCLKAWKQLRCPCNSKPSLYIVYNEYANITYLLQLSAVIMGRLGGGEGAKASPVSLKLCKNFYRIASENCWTEMLSEFFNQ